MLGKRSRRALNVPESNSPMMKSAFRSSPGSISPSCAQGWSSGAIKTIGSHKSDRFDIGKPRLHAIQGEMDLAFDRPRSASPWGETWQVTRPEEKCGENAQEIRQGIFTGRGAAADDQVAVKFP